MAEKQKVILEVEAKTSEANKSLEKVKTTTKDTSNAATDAAMWSVASPSSIPRSDGEQQAHENQSNT